MNLNNINYVRTLRDCKCTECGFIGYDVNFENIIMEVESESKHGRVYNTHIKMICPECGVVNKCEIGNL